MYSVGAAIRSRISMYSNTVLINKLPIEIKKPTSKFESLSYTLQRGAIGGNSSSSNSTERVLLKGSVTVHKGILCFYEDGGGGGGGIILCSSSIEVYIVDINDISLYDIDCRWYHYYNYSYNI